MPNDFLGFSCEQQVNEKPHMISNIVLIMVTYQKLLFLSNLDLSLFISQLNCSFFFHKDGFLIKNILFRKPFHQKSIGLR